MTGKIYKQPSISSRRYTYYLTSGQSYQCSFPSGCGLVVISGEGPNCELGYIAPYYHRNQFGKNLGAAVMNYQYRGSTNVSVSITTIGDLGGIQITNNSGTGMSFGMAFIYTDR